MINEPREQWYGATISEYVDGCIGGLESDAEVLGDIIATGRYGFGFDDADLAAFVRRCIIAMVEHGARPVLGGGDSGYYWIVQPQYGSTPDEIADSVIAEWRRNGDPDHGGLWFALPRAYEARWKK